MKLSLKLILEDLDINKLSYNNVGLYAFIQAMNKHANDGPVPMPVIDIIQNDSLEYNPGPFTYSGNSFKIQMNAQTELPVDFTTKISDHDIFHALTTNLAKHFARVRASIGGSKANQIGVKSQKTHFDRPSVDRNGVAMKMTSHPSAISNIGNSRFSGLAQNDREEIFGNLLERSFGGAVQNNTPAYFNGNDVEKWIQGTQNGFKGSNDMTPFVNKFVSYLSSVVGTYNLLLRRYQKVIHARQSNNKLWDKTHENNELMSNLGIDMSNEYTSKSHPEKKYDKTAVISAMEEFIKQEKRRTEEGSGDEIANEWSDFRRSVPGGDKFPRYEIAKQIYLNARNK